MGVYCSDTVKVSLTNRAYTRNPKPYEHYHSYSYPDSRVRVLVDSGADKHGQAELREGGPRAMWLWDYLDPETLPFSGLI